MTIRGRWAAVLVGIGFVAVVVGLAGCTDNEPSFPSFSSPVVDQADVVPEGVEQRVNAALEDYQARSSNQVAVAVVETTADQSIEDYSIDLARAWGAGEEGKDNGVVLVIAYDDRKLRIEVGRGLEGELTDLESGRIIRERLVPLLSEGDVGAAVEQGTQAIRQQLGDTQVGELPPPPSFDEEPSSGGNGGWPLWLLLAFVPVLGLPLLAAGRGGRGGRYRNSDPPIFFGSGWGGYGGGWGGGYGGGGGFGGGGGGGFGGGGASGGW